MELLNRIAPDPIDDLPQRPESHDTAEAAELAFSRAIDAEKLFIVQKKDLNDYGTDIHIEALRGDDVTNLRVPVQLKGTAQDSNSDGSVSVSVARTNLNYLLAQPYSMFVCFHVPTQCLLASFAADVYTEYEHSGAGWTEQQTLTVRFTTPFDADFQRRLNAQVLASGNAARDRRLDWAVTPPERVVQALRTMARSIDVSTDRGRAIAMLVELYNAGEDTAISVSFEAFAAVLGDEPGAMDRAYMAEINLGLNGAPFHPDRVRAAIEVLELARSRREMHPASILYCQGNAWLALGEHAVAVEVFRRAVPVLERSDAGIAAKCAKNLGSALEALGDSEGARAEYERALRLDPDLSEANMALALWHRRERGDAQTALAYLDKVVPSTRSAIRMPNVVGWRIELLFRVADYDSAFREISTLLGHAGENTWVWPWCARQVASFGRTTSDATAKALHFWNSYLRENPSVPPAQRERLLCIARLERIGVATGVDFETFKAAAIALIDGGDSAAPLLWDLIGHWAQRAKDWPEAEAAFRKAYETDPRRFGCCWATALNFLGRYAEALPVLEAEAEAERDAINWFQIATAQEALRNVDGAIEAYEHAIDLDESYALAWFNLGGMLWNSGQHARAASVWETAIARFPTHELAAVLRKEFAFLFRNDDRETTPDA